MLPLPSALTDNLPLTSQRRVTAAMLRCSRVSMSVFVCLCVCHAKCCQTETSTALLDCKRVYSRQRSSIFHRYHLYRTDVELFCTFMVCFVSWILKNHWINQFIVGQWPCTIPLYCILTIIAPLGLCVRKLFGSYRAFVDDEIPFNALLKPLHSSRIVLKCSGRCPNAL